MLFSQRKGYKPISNTIQKEDMDEPLRHGLWDALHLTFWDKEEYNQRIPLRYSTFYHLFLQSIIWHRIQKNDAVKAPIVQDPLEYPVVLIPYLEYLQKIYMT